jgi:hypothetical protein
MEDFLDFDRMREGHGIETINMKDFLESVAAKGLLSRDLPKNDTELCRQPLWDYLESSCYSRQWSPGKTFMAFNLSNTHTDVVSNIEPRRRLNIPTDTQARRQLSAQSIILSNMQSDMQTDMQSKRRLQMVEDKENSVININNDKIEPNIETNKEGAAINEYSLKSILQSKSQSKYMSKSQYEYKSRKLLQSKYVTKLQSESNTNINAETTFKSVLFGTFNEVSDDRMTHISLQSKRQLSPYNTHLHSQRVVYLPGHDKNRLLTLWFSYFFFAEESEERGVKRYMRDRVRYHDSIFCAAGRVIDLLLYNIVKGRAGGGGGGGDTTNSNNNIRTEKEKVVQNVHDVSVRPLPLVSYVQDGNDRVYKLLPVNQSYIAYHIRRGDFQQQHTRLESQKILDLTLHLIPGKSSVSVCAWWVCVCVAVGVVCVCVCSYVRVSVCLSVCVCVVFVCAMYVCLFVRACVHMCLTVSIA